MMATLLGAAVSDGLENGQVVSGVGGQYNFVAQAFALPGARSILALEATRQPGAKAQSNIRWTYAHLRDIVVTEYGVADLRGKSDADVIAAMLQVADSRGERIVDSVDVVARSRVRAEGRHLVMIGEKSLQVVDATPFVAAPPASGER